MLWHRWKARIAVQQLNTFRAMENSSISCCRGISQVSTKKSLLTIARAFHHIQIWDPGRSNDNWMEHAFKFHIRSYQTEIHFRQENTFHNHNSKIVLKMQQKTFWLYIPTPVFPTTRGALGWAAFRSCNSSKVTGEIHIIRSPWKTRVLFGWFSAILWCGNTADLHT